MDDRDRDPGRDKDEPQGDDTEGHRRHFKASEPAPDEPQGDDTEGHRRHFKASEPAPDEPKGNDTEGHSARR
jgi:hypothetical protein